MQLNGKELGIILGSIVAIVIASFLVSAYVLHPGSVGGGLSPYQPAPGYVLLNGTACSTSLTVYPHIALEAAYISGATGLPVTAAIAYNVTPVPATGVALVSSVSSATAYLNTTGTTLVCGHNYQVIWGDGTDALTNAYASATPPFTLPSSGVTLPVFLYQKPAALQSVTWDNQTLFGNSIVTPGRLVTAGGSYTFALHLYTGAGAFRRKPDFARI